MPEVFGTSESLGGPLPLPPQAPARANAQKLGNVSGGLLFTIRGITISLGGGPRRGRPTVHLSSNEGGGPIPGVLKPFCSPQSCEGVICFALARGQETPWEPQTLFVHLSSYEEGLIAAALSPARFKGDHILKVEGRAAQASAEGKDSGALGFSQFV